MSIPTEIVVDGRRNELKAPNETGIRLALIEILLDDCYGLRYLRDSGVQTVIDVGANVGFFALAARREFPRATIHSYEPNPRLLPFLAHHSHLIGSQCFAEAVGRKSGYVELLDHVDSVQARTRENSNGGLLQVALGNALERIGGHCDLVKMDCEGAEWDMLADKGPWQQVDRLAMEYHLWASGHGHESVPEILRSIGFRVTRQFVLHSTYGIVWASRNGV